MRRVVLYFFVLCLVGCAYTTQEGTVCQRNAWRKNKYWSSRGYPTRLGYGVVKFRGMVRNKYYDPKRKGIGHMWCEYYRDGDWILAKDTIRGYGGWPIEEYDGLYFPRYYRYTNGKQEIPGRRT